MHKVRLFFIAALLVLTSCSHHRDWSSDKDFYNAIRGKSANELKALLGPPDALLETFLPGRKTWYYEHLHVRDPESGAVRHVAQIDVAEGQVVDASLQ